MNSKINNQEIYKKCLNKEDFAYWAGVAQTDGYFKRQFVKSKQKERFLIVLTLGPKSLPMQDKFKEISQKLFGKRGSLYRFKRKEGFLSFEYKFGCKDLIGLFEEFKIDFSAELIPPPFVLKNDSLFGAYLAGLIDGDGDIRIWKNKYPTSHIRITGKYEQRELINAIKSKFNCGVYTESRTQEHRIAKRKFTSHWQITEFAISSKNNAKIRKYVLKHIALPHKKDKIIKYFKMRGWPVGIGPTSQDFY